MQRRDFIRAGAATAALVSAGLPACGSARDVPEVTADNIPKC